MPKLDDSFLYDDGESRLDDAFLYADDQEKEPVDVNPNKDLRKPDGLKEARRHTKSVNGAL